MRIATVATGGIGGFLAFKLTKGGHQVATIARGPHLDPIVGNGLALDGPTGVESIRPWIATDDPSQIGVLGGGMMISTASPNLKPTRLRRSVSNLGHLLQHILECSAAVSILRTKAFFVEKPSGRQANQDDSCRHNGARDKPVALGAFAKP
jgi:ketopantoate reductase PanE/ApbA-like protein